MNITWKQCKHDLLNLIFQKLTLADKVMQLAVAICYFVCLFGLISSSISLGVFLINVVKTANFDLGLILMNDAIAIFVLFLITYCLRYFYRFNKTLKTPFKKNH